MARMLSRGEEDKGGYSEGLWVAGTGWGHSASPQVHAQPLFPMPDRCLLEN